MGRSRIVLALSGGLDSACLFEKAWKDGQTVVPVVFRYPSKHNVWEREAANKVVEHFYGKGTAALKEINVSGVFESFKSDLLENQGDIPEGHYAHESMTATVVPARNLIFASILAGYADSIGADLVGLGVHAGDHHIYPDCRPEFICSLGATIAMATEHRVGLYAPFLMMEKKDIVKFGLLRRVPFHLTRTCYKQQEVACGKCGSCCERLEAFALNGASDPIEYSPVTL